MSPLKDVRGNAHGSTINKSQKVETNVPYGEEVNRHVLSIQWNIFQQ